MTMRVCAEPGCPAIQPEVRCSKHRSAREVERGTKQERGYDARHGALRRRFQGHMAKGARYRCWRCKEPIDPSNWTLGHCDDDRSQYHGPECPPCDYATSGRGACPHPSHVSTR